MTAPLVDQLFLGFQNAIAGRYALEREIGRGGMGIVYLASDVALDRPVAIKLLPPALAAVPGLRARFLGEARTAARLSHPNVVPIFAVDEAGSFVYFVMAYVAGGTLGDQLRKRGTLPPPQAARILRDVAWALDYAHGMGIIHRDVKPDNILIEEGSSRTMVADFGIAARADSPWPGEGEAISGTSGFMSPEQATGGAIDGRSDLYALGVVGHLALSGRMPDAEASLSQLSPQAPRALVQVIERCLAPRRGDRWSAGREVADALDRTGGGDLPAPLRMWLTRGQELGLPMTVWTVLIAVPTLFDMFFPPNYVRSVATLLLPLFSPHSPGWDMGSGESTRLGNSWPPDTGWPTCNTLFRSTPHSAPRNSSSSSVRDRAAWAGFFVASPSAEWRCAPRPSSCTAATLTQPCSTGSSRWPPGPEWGAPFSDWPSRGVTCHAIGSSSTDRSSGRVAWAGGCCGLPVWGCAP